MYLCRLLLVQIKASNYQHSARLTDQHGSYAFSCTPFTIHVRHLLPASDIKQSCDFNAITDEEQVLEKGLTKSLD